MPADATDLEQTTSFLSGANAAFIAELYARYLEDPPVGRSELARAIFAELGDESASGRCRIISGASWAPPRAARSANGRWRRSPVPMATRAGEPRATTGSGGQADLIEARAPRRIRSAPCMLIRAYRVRGHLRPISIRWA